MTHKTITSPLALAAAAILAVTPAAFAQTTIGGQEITPGDLPIVEAHCQSLVGIQPGLDVDPASGNADARDVQPIENRAELGADLSAPVSPEGNFDSGNIDAENLGPTEGEVVASSDAPEVDPSSGNVDADDAILAELNVQEITLADCQAAGLAG